MPDTIRVTVPSEDVAARLAGALHDCRVDVASDDSSWFLEIVCDREFNELLLRVLDGAHGYLALDPTAALRLEVDGRSYPLHPPPAAAPAPA